MSLHTTTHILPSFRSTARSEEQTEVPALVLLWSADAPERLGELLLPGSDDKHSFGRGRPTVNGELHRLQLMRQRPGEQQTMAPLLTPSLSREQLVLERRGDLLWMQNVGRCRAFVNGVAMSEALLSPGDVLSLEGCALFVCSLRPLRMPPLPPDAPVAPHAFGEPDAEGMVGESPMAWGLRRQLSFLARRTGHVLILGESGTGKEVAARAIHALSRRSARTMIARNAATIPEGLVDAELFGNAKNYPNPGMAERPGLIGEAHGSTLFLDELGELPQSLQAHLLRVLDMGEYQRLGETTLRRADFRLLAATNRSPESLKHDVAARLKLRVTVPNLNQRREDIPLLVRHLLKRIAADDPELARRFLPSRALKAEPALTQRLMERLVRHTYTTHIRELEGLLWRSIQQAEEGVLDVSPEATSSSAKPTSVPSIESPSLEPVAAVTPALTSEPESASASTPASPPESEGWTGALSEIERWRLQLFRRYRFNLSATCRDEAYQVSRATADFHLRLLTFRVLALADWQEEEAVSRLMGEDVSLRPRLESRLRASLENLTQRLARDGEAALRSRLAAEYGLLYPTVEAVLDALVQQKVGETRA